MSPDGYQYYLSDSDGYVRRYTDYTYEVWAPTRKAWKETNGFLSRQAR